MEDIIIKSLSEPAAFPEPTRRVTLVQTHVSLIFITDSFVYKIKKPVDLGFLNFSTIDRRRFYCKEEVRLNQRLCPDLYLGVVELREADSGVSFTGAGKVVDYAVRMKRLPEERMLTHLLATRQVGSDEFREIARIVGAFHLGAERGPEIDARGTAEAVRLNWSENLDEIGEFVGKSLAIRDLETIRDWAFDFIATHEGLFAERVEQGFIRDCDGDIHSGNICVADRIYIFDCIEFNSRFRCCDTTADIAFLLMDLDFHRSGKFGEAFLDEYLKVTGDSGGVALLDFYKAYRAVVRGKVESLRLKDPLIPAPEREAALDRSRRYFRLARGYAVRGKLPRTMFLMSGLTGTGKSSIADELAFQLGLDIFSSDLTRKRLAGVAPAERHRDAYEEGIYSPDQTTATYSELMALTEGSLKRGKSAVVDATFRHWDERARFREIGENSSARCVILETTCPEQLVRKRLDARTAEDASVSDGRWEVFLRQKEDYEPPDRSEGPHMRLDTSLDPTRNVELILEQLGLLAHA